MKIAQVPPLYEAVPPRLYGGTERVVAHLTDALVDLGHEVTLFASAEAQTRARLVPVRDQAIRLDPAPLKSDLAAHMTLLSTVLDRAGEFDLIHFHTDMIHFPFFADHAARTVTTLHGRLDLKDLDRVYARWNEFALVSISDDQRRPMPFANWQATVHHGMPAELYDFAPESQGYLAFLGRISPEKRPDRAIRIATALGRPLKIAAKVDAADHDYFEQTIRPMLDNPLVEFIGEIGDDQKSAFLGGAEALLFPIDWPEPFGLGMDEAIAAAGRAHRLDRAQIRERFDVRFSATAMARRYLDVYADMLARRPFAEAVLDRPVRAPRLLRPRRAEVATRSSPVAGPAADHPTPAPEMGLG